MTSLLPARPAQAKPGLWKRLSEFLNLGIISVAAILSLGLTVVAHHTYYTIADSVRVNLTQWLQTTLNADINKIEVWFLAKRPALLRVAGHPDVERLVQELLGLDGREFASRRQLIESPPQEELRRLLGPIAAQEGFHGFLICTPQGRILASDESAPIGTLFPAAYQEYLQQGFEGKAVIADSFLPPSPQRPVPELFISARVQDTEGNPAALISFRLRPDLSIAPLLGKGRDFSAGVTGIFNKDGFIVSDLSQGLRRVDWLAADARGGSDEGLLLERYPNYRGISAVGAWRWLPEYHLGLLTEVDGSTAYRSLAVLYRAFGLIFGLLVLSTLGILLISYTLIVVRRRANAVLQRARQLGQYTLEEMLGRGGMGEVYKARHQLLRRPTAIKLIHSDRVSEKRLALFEREVQLTSMLTHPNTIAIYDYGRSHDNIFYYAMEYLAGITLKQLVADYGPQDGSRVIHILCGVCGSLEEAHGVGLVHRDIKPANVMLCQLGGVRDVVKVLDFGLVKELKSGSEHDDEFLAGTLRFSAPEVLGPPRVFDVRSDIYSVGALAYYLLTGLHVFAAGDDMEYFRKLCTSEADAPSSRLAGKPITFAPDLEALVMQCLRNRPEERPQRIQEVAAQLRACSQAGQWTRERADGWWGTYKPVPPRLDRGDESESSLTIEPAQHYLDVELQERK